MSTATTYVKTEKQRVPALRFNGFDEGWTKEKAGELCDCIVPGRNKPKKFDGDIAWITTPDIIHNSYIFNSKSSLGISKEEAKSVGSKIAPKNSVIISCVGDLGLVAISGIELVINQQLHAFLPSEKVEYRFLMYSITTQGRYIDRVATKTAVPYMNKNNCNSIPVYLPSLPEQQKIASFLAAVDEKIQQLTKKKALLEEYKKGVMQQLFSGQLRFKDENGEAYPDWEEKRLGDIGDLKNGLNKDKKDFGFGSPFVNLMDVFGQCELNNQKFGLVNSNEKEKELYNVLKGDVLFIRSSVKRTGVGETVIIQEDLPKTVYSGFLIRFRDDRKSLYQDYKKYCFASQDFREELLSYATSSANTNINQESLNKIRVVVPVIEEQQKIATYLSSIDTKIGALNNQITQTQTFKKGLLQQLFV
jgi:type I restriction enzyme S subunit